MRITELNTSDLLEAIPMFISLSDTPVSLEDYTYSLEKLRAGVINSTKELLRRGITLK